MRYYPRNEADSEELEVFFLELARKNAFNLRVKNSNSAFVFKRIINEYDREQDDTWMNVDVANTSDRAVRIDRKCWAGALHQILEKMRVPHEYRKEGFEEGLCMSAYVARKHLEKAFDMLHHGNEEGKQTRHSRLDSGGHRR